MKIMDNKAIFKLCKDLGCCDPCAVRYLGVRKPNVYENLKEHVLQYKDTPTEPETIEEKPSTDPRDPNVVDNKTVTSKNGHETSVEDNGSTDDSPAAKRMKLEACVSCLGILEQETWAECNEMVKEVLDKKGYDSTAFACALSAPISTLLREKVLTLKIQDAIPDYDANTVTPLKEAWKWLYGSVLSKHINMSLDSGAICPLLITITMEYPNEATELELLKSISPELFESRSKQKRRFAVQFSRKAAEQALEASPHNIRKVGEQLEPAMRSRCVSVSCARDPIYIGGRYLKLSRELPQTPWLVAGTRMMESSVQEVIFEPLAKILGIPVGEAEHRLKFMSAGREDVDVRCLGDGRPFAVEVADPRRTPSREELQAVREAVEKSGKVIVNRLCVVSKEELTVLKQGEEKKCKTYEALCIKLTHSKWETDKTPSDPITVTSEDITNINTYRNTPTDHQAAVLITQRTPIRVLHRRPLLNRQREILSMQAATVPGHPQLFTLRVMTSAGTYVKEWVHSEFGRSAPSLATALQARADILAIFQPPSGPYNATLQDEDIVVISNPVEARLPSGQISIGTLRRILEARADAARVMPSSPTTIMNIPSNNMTTVEDATGGDNITDTDAAGAQTGNPGNNANTSGNAADGDGSTTVANKAVNGDGDGGGDGGDVGGVTASGNGGDGEGN